MELEKDEVYTKTLTHKVIEEINKNSIIEEYYKRLKESFNTLTLDNMQISSTTINIASGFLNKNKIPALMLNYKTGKLTKVSAFFFITNVGNIFTFSLYLQVSKGLIDVLTGVSNPTERILLIESKLKSIEEIEEFSIFNAVANIMYEKGIKTII